MLWWYDEFGMASPNTASSPTAPGPSDDPKADTPKHAIPVWMIGLVLFLLSIIVGMGIYIGIQKGMFAMSPSVSGDHVLSPSPFPSPTEATIPSDWLTYTNPEIGMQLRYPATVAFNADTYGASQSSLRISVDLIETLPQEAPLGMDRKTALADKAALEKGQAQTIGDFAASDALVRIGGKYNGRLTSVLSRFEVCSVLFERTLVFYPGEYKVTISLDGPTDAIIASMPEFFTTDPANCGNQLVWNRDTMGDFMPTLAKGEGKGAAQVWYDTFTQIIQTITFVPLGAPMISPLPQGCEISDNAYCNVLSDIKSSMAGARYAGFLSYQTPTSVTCDPDGMAIAACEGKAKGTVIEGYMVGYPQSEGAILSRDAYTTGLTNFTAGEPFSYHGSVVGGDKGIAVFVNPSKTKMIAFPLIRTGATWRMNVTLFGRNLQPSSEYLTLPQSLLETF